MASSNNPRLCLSIVISVWYLVKMYWSQMLTKCKSMFLRENIHFNNMKFHMFSAEPILTSLLAVAVIHYFLLFLGLVTAQNLALNKPMLFSSMGGGQASNANDGNANTVFFTHDSPWSFAAVDLEDTYEIGSISLKVSAVLRKLNLDSSYRWHLSWENLVSISAIPV